MSTPRNFKKYTIWILAMEIVREVYGITKKIPKEEVYGLCSQIRRCAVSVPSNIAAP
jgi:four helix bundle protein